MRSTCAIAMCECLGPQTTPPPRLEPSLIGRGRLPKTRGRRGRTASSRLPPRRCWWCRRVVYVRDCDSRPAASAVTREKETAEPVQKAEVGYQTEPLNNPATPTTGLVVRNMSMDAPFDPLYARNAYLYASLSLPQTTKIRILAK